MRWAATYSTTMHRRCGRSSAARPPATTRLPPSSWAWSRARPSNLEVRTEKLEVKTLVTLLALAVATPASAAWRRVDSANFIIVGDASARELRGFAARFEGFHEELRRIFGEAMAASPVPTIVFVFPSDQALTPFKPLYQGKPRPLAGYAASGRDANYIAMQNAGSSDYTERVIFHEYMHLAIANGITGIPPWLNEGLAEFYST